MKNTGAIFLILFGLFGLYLYNTGRAAAIVQVLKDPASPPTTGQRLNVMPIDTTGVTLPGKGFDLGNVGSILGGIGDLFGGIFGGI